MMDAGVLLLSCAVDWHTMLCRQNKEIFDAEPCGRRPSHDIVVRTMQAVVMNYVLAFDYKHAAGFEYAGRLFDCPDVVGLKF